MHCRIFNHISDLYLLDTSIPLPHLSMDFPGGSDGKESTCKARDLGLIPGLQRSPGGGNGN